MAEFFRFLMESNLTTAAFVIGAFAFIIAIIGRIKTIIEPSPAMRFVLALFGLFLMSLSFVSYVGSQPSQEPPAVTVSMRESSSPIPSNSQIPRQVTQQPLEVPTQPTAVMSPTSVPPPLLLTKGKLVYEDSFDTSFGWNIEEGMNIENGNLIIWPGYDAVPKDPASYADFIFESRFYVPISGSMAFYLRHQRPPCPDWICSIQIALYYNNGYQELAARRFLGDEPSQQFDLKKARITFLNVPGWNKIIVQAKGSVYTVYVNDRFVFDFTDDTYTSGAFVIDNAPDSKSEIKVDYIRIFQIP